MHDFGKHLRTLAVLALTPETLDEDLDAKPLPALAVVQDFETTIGSQSAVLILLASMVGTTSSGGDWLTAAGDGALPTEWVHRHGCTGRRHVTIKGVISVFIYLVGWIQLNFAAWQAGRLHAYTLPAVSALSFDCDGLPRLRHRERALLSVRTMRQ
jgi:hypothetical protein